MSDSRLKNYIKGAIAERFNHSVSVWDRQRYSSSSMHSRSIFFRTDDAGSFLSLHDKAKVDATFKRQETLAVFKLTRDELPPVQHSVLTVAQIDHFTTTCKHGVWYSVPAGGDVEIKTFDAFFRSPQSFHVHKRQKRFLGYEEKMVLDVDASIVNDRVFFKLALLGLGRKKTMKLSPASGRKLGRTDLT